MTMSATGVQIGVVALFALTCGALAAAWTRGRLGATAIALFVVASLVWVASFAAIVSGYHDADGFADAMIGVPVEGPLKLYQNDPLVWGDRVFQRECAACHSPAKTEPYEAAICLDGYASRTWIKKLVKDPSTKHFFGNTKLDGMEPFTGDEETLSAIVEYVYSQTGKPDADQKLAAQGAVLYDKEGCLECHTTSDDPDGWTGADLKGWGSEPWLAGFIREPGHARFYGKAIEMDDFDVEKLSKAELQAVIAWLRSQSDEKAGF